MSSLESSGACVWCIHPKHEFEQVVGWSVVVTYKRVQYVLVLVLGLQLTILMGSWLVKVLVVCGGWNWWLQVKV